MLTLILTSDEVALQWARRVSSAVGSKGYRVFADWRSALAAMVRERFDLVIVDWDLPAGGAPAFVRAARVQPADAHVPIVSMVASSDARSRLEALDAGVTGVFRRVDDIAEIVAWLLSLFALVQANRSRSVWEDAESPALGCAVLPARDHEVLLLLARVLEHRDNDTGDHTLRVARHSETLARELGLSAVFCRAIRLTAPLHDIGKVAIPDPLLLKPGRLTEDEMAVVRTHAQIGERILSVGTSPLVRLAAEIAGYHHERWDGTGYPRGVSGSDIPLSARIVAVADVFDAMTSERPYKAALPIQEALDHIQAEAGRHFDPECAAAFVAVYKAQHALCPPHVAEISGPSLPAHASDLRPSTPAFAARTKVVARRRSPKVPLARGEAGFAAASI